MFPSESVSLVCLAFQVEDGIETRKITKLLQVWFFLTKTRPKVFFACQQTRNPMTLSGFPRQSYVPFVLALPQRKLLIAWFKNKQATGVGWNLKKLAGKMKTFNKKTHLKMPKGWTPMTFLKACNLP